jgi:endonuclease/exonuclease/phosphatase family metal-dependent hydrolase
MLLKLFPMKKTLFLFLCLMMFSLSNYAQMIVASYNLRYANSQDIGNLWTDRAPIVANLIRFHDFDIFGSQEGLVTQLEYLIKHLPQYERSGIGRDDGKEAGEFSAIFYKKEKFTLIEKGDFWLSETPDTPSLGWDAQCCKRICSWVYLQDKTSGKKFARGFTFRIKPVVSSFIFLTLISIIRVLWQGTKAVN